MVSEPQLVIPDPEESVPEIKEEEWQRAKSRHGFTFQDLMKVKVSLKTDILPGFETLMEQSGSHGWVLDAEEERKEGSSISSSIKGLKEVKLPLKDILSVVLLVASFDEDMQNILHDDDSTSEASGSSTGPAVDPRESVPLIKKILVEDSHLKPPNGPNLQDKDKLGPYHRSSFSNYLEDCSTHIGQGILPPQDEDDRFLKVNIV